MAANTVAVVSRVPVAAGTVTKPELHRALMQAAAAAGRQSAPKPGGNGYGKLEETAIGELLDGIWVRGQAAEMGIGVRRRQVARELARLKKLAFESKAEYHRFLKEAHFTRRDVIDRVEVQIFSARIQERLVEGLTGKSTTRKVFEKFLAEYQKRWRSRTVCAAEYAIDRCSNVRPG